MAYMVQNLQQNWHDIPKLPYYLVYISHHSLTENHLSTQPLNTDPLGLSSNTQTSQSDAHILPQQNRKKPDRFQQKGSMTTRWAQTLVVSGVIIYNPSYPFIRVKKTQLPIYF